MKRIFMAMIRFYRKRISPLKPPCCRFTPTCSAYALEAFEKRGCIAGFVLMVWRILRCSPLSPAGYDPVPEEGFRTLPMRWSTFRRMQDELPKIPLGDVPCDTAETSCEHLNANEEAESTTKTESEGPRA
ncbi:MAG: membrane protein insertion efficiency factor YidD [Ruminococcaceae bacterium]|nr:membrane protein insertion efficiency factor YidD [Oscillospiraceae bacterium]